MAHAVDVAKTYWMQAIEEKIGLALIVSDPARAKSQLYAARKLLPIPDLANYEIRTSPINPAYELWIIRKAPGVLDTASA